MPIQTLIPSKAGDGNARGILGSLMKCRLRRFLSLGSLVLLASGASFAGLKTAKYKMAFKILCLGNQETYLGGRGGSRIAVEAEAVSNIENILVDIRDACRGSTIRWQPGSEYR